jgi:hypothetical protein
VKNLNWLLAALAMASLAIVGCKKHEVQHVDYVMVNGVSVNMPKLESTFTGTADADIQKLVFDADQGFRYGDYTKALAAVDELSNKPGLTDDQKKVATDVVEQLKKVTGAAPAAAPAQ